MANLAEIYISRNQSIGVDRIIVNGIYQGPNTDTSPAPGDAITTFSASFTNALFVVPTAVKVDINPHFRVGVARAVVTWEGWRIWAA
jgi:hypothetical protein